MGYGAGQVFKSASKVSTQKLLLIQQQHQDWVKEIMLETWQEHLDGIKTKVKVDVP